MGRSGWLTLTAAVLAGCAAPGTDLEALPFYREDRTDPAVTRVDAPPILLAFDAADLAPVESGASAAVPGEPPHEDRPLLPDQDHRGLAWLLRFPWPFGLITSDGKHRSVSVTGFLAGEGVGTQPGPAGRLLSPEGAVRHDGLANFASDPEAGGIGTLPFVFYDNFVDHGDLPDYPTRDEDHDVGLLPLFAWGDGDREEESYFALMPFGGVTRGQWGKEEITWVGFPYPLYACAQDRMYRSHHVLWPLVNWIDGDTRPEPERYGEAKVDGFRVLPFYGHYERTSIRGEPVYDRTFVMWPFLTWASDGLNEPVPTETFMAFPFFGSLEAPERSVTTVMFPFLKWEEDRRWDTWEVRAPFPFVKVGGGGDGRWQLDLWPLWGAKHRPGVEEREGRPGRPTYDRWFALWPLVRAESLEGGGGRDYSGVYALPLFWRTAWSKAGERDEVSMRVFPLLHWRHRRDGSAEWAVLSPWWRDDDGFQRVLGPFLRLYRWSRDRHGGTEHQALLGLASWRDLPAVPGRPEYSRLSVLFGLVQVRSLGDEGGLRLLWLPEITWGSP